MLKIINTAISYVLNQLSELKKKRPSLISTFENLTIQDYLDLRENVRTILMSNAGLEINPTIDLSDNFRLVYQSTQKAFCKLEISNANFDAVILDLLITINNQKIPNHISIKKDCSFTYLLCFDKSIFNDYYLNNQKREKQITIQYRYRGLYKEKLEQTTVLNLFIKDEEPEIELVGEQISDQKVVRFWSKT